MKNEIVLYQANDLKSLIEVRIANESVGLNRQQISALFSRDVKTIGKHINNVFSEGELEDQTTVAKFATVQNEGDRAVERLVEYFNLDVIISVCYRVKSKQGTQFRIWATRVLKDYLLKGYALNQRMNRIEKTVENLTNKMKEIHQELKTNQLPTQGVFFDGQIFDAYELASKIIRSAKKSLILIDNYIDETTLTHLAKKHFDVSVLLLSKKSDAKIDLDVKKVNDQFGGFTLKQFACSHDRFLLVDNTEVYHLGASLKDLGKKHVVSPVEPWFAFSKMDVSSVGKYIESDFLFVLEVYSYKELNLFNLKHLCHNLNNYTTALTFQ